MEGLAIGDFKGLQDLKRQAQTDDQKALPEVAKQFEAIFLQSLLKSMRSGGQHILNEDSPFKSDTQNNFQEMLDAQYANDIAHGQGVGLAAMLAQQLKQGLSDSKNSPTDLQQLPCSSRIAPRMMDSSKAPSSTSKTSIDEFVKSIWPYAQQAAGLLGLDPKILMAQAALETGWGQFISKGEDGATSNNLFNIKAKTDAENAVHINTTEFITNTPIKVNASFRKYPSIEHSFNDYVALIKGNSRYEAALANSQNPERYVNELHRAGYATDPEYSSKILAIYHGDELQEALERNGFSFD